MKTTFTLICALLMIIATAPLGLAGATSEQSFTYVGGTAADDLPFNPGLCWNVQAIGEFAGVPGVPNVGGRCYVELASTEVTITVDDATHGLMDFGYLAEDANGDRCAEDAQAPSGETISLPASCVEMSIFTLAGATTGTITVVS